MHRKTKRTLRAILSLLAVAFLAAAGYLHENAPSTQPGAPAAEGTYAHFIDVGQGDSTLLVSDGKAILIDAGPAEGGKIVAQYLHDLNIDSLYAVIATHPHADHIGGMATILDEFPVEHFFLPDATTNTMTFARLLEQLESKGIQPVVPKRGDSITLGSDATLTFLTPIAELKANNLNNTSLVTVFQSGDTRVLVMGDAEKEVENALLEDLSLPLSSTVLRTGHHGSSSSSTPAFLKAVHPQIAIISCAAQNDYGHPHAETLENLKNAGIEDVRITAQLGTIVLNLSQLPPTV